MIDSRQGRYPTLLSTCVIHQSPALCYSTHRHGEETKSNKIKLRQIRIKFRPKSDQNQIRSQSDQNHTTNRSNQTKPDQIIRVRSDQSRDQNQIRETKIKQEQSKSHQPTTTLPSTPTYPTKPTPTLRRPRSVDSTRPSAPSTGCARRSPLRGCPASGASGRPTPRARAA